jgi:hypothetical protein
MIGALVGAGSLWAIHPPQSFAMSPRSSQI